MNHRKAKRYQVCKGCGELNGRAHGKPDGKNCPCPGYTWIQVPPKDSK